MNPELSVVKILVRPFHDRWRHAVLYLEPNDLEPLGFHETQDGYLSVFRKLTQPASDSERLQLLVVAEDVDRFPARVSCHHDRESSKADLSGLIAEDEVRFEADVDEVRASIVAGCEHPVKGGVHSRHHELPLLLEFSLGFPWEPPVTLDVEIDQLAVPKVRASLLDRSDLAFLNTSGELCRSDRLASHGRDHVVIQMWMLRIGKRCVDVFLGARLRCPRHL